MVLRLKSPIAFSFIIVFNIILHVTMNCGMSSGAFAAEEKNLHLKFDTQDIEINKKKIHVEIAKTTEQQQHGLMYREALPKNEGMLFIFENEQPLSFWMKNTYIDLAIAYIDKNKVIVDIQEMKATNQMIVGEPPSYPSAKPAMYALEMNAGWFKKNKIHTGQKFNFLKK